MAVADCVRARHTGSTIQEQQYFNIWWPRNSNVGSGESQNLICTLVVILAAVMVSSVISDNHADGVESVTFSSDLLDDTISTEVLVIWIALLLVHFQTYFFSLCIYSVRFLVLFSFQGNSSRTLWLEQMEAEFKNKISPTEISKRNREKKFQVCPGHALIE